MLLSIVLPCYNEGIKLKHSVEEIMRYMKKSAINDYEFVIVNDGSTDDTLSHLVNIKESNPDLIKVVHYKENKGKGHAIKKGIFESSGDYILFMDADLSTHLKAIRKCNELIHDKEFEYPIIIGSRRLKDSELVVSQGTLRKFIGKCCSIYTNLVLNLNIKDTQCGFKCFRRDVALEFAEMQTIDRWAFDVEYLYMAKLNNLPVIEIPVRWANDEDSRVTPIKSSLRFVSDLHYIKKNKKNYIIDTDFNISLV